MTEGVNATFSAGGARFDELFRYETRPTLRGAIDGRPITRQEGRRMEFRLSLCQVTQEFSNLRNERRRIAKTRMGQRYLVGQWGSYRKEAK